MVTYARCAVSQQRYIITPPFITHLKLAVFKSGDQGKIQKTISMIQKKFLSLMYILKVHTRGSIRVAKFLAGSLSSSRGGNFKILRLKIAIFEDFSNRCIWPTKSITTMKFGLRACFNLKFIRVVQKNEILKIYIIKVPIGL